MLRISEAIREAPWDPDFRAEAELILIGEVVPALQVLEEIVQKSNSVTHFVDTAISDRQVLGCIALDMASFQQLAGDLLGVPPEAVAGLLASHVAWKAEA